MVFCRTAAISCAATQQQNRPRRTAQARHRRLKPPLPRRAGDAVGGVAEVRLGVSVEPWTYKQPLVAAAYRSAGPHTVVLQVVEGEGAGG